MTKWLRLRQPTTAWNGPRVKIAKHKYTKIIEANETPADMVANRIGEGTVHLVINCHGHGGPTLELGTNITVDNLKDFIPLAGMPELKVIWFTACNVRYYPMGDTLCANLAKNAQAYVIASYTGLPDLKPPENCVEDAYYSMRGIFKPSGDMAPPDYLYDILAPWAGIERV